MRVLQWAMPFLPVMGGREVFVDRLTHALADRGHDVRVAAPDLRGARLPALDDRDLPYPVLRLPLGGLFVEGTPLASEEAVASAAELLRAFDPDVVHAHNVGPDVLVLRRACAEAGVRPRLILTHHGRSDALDSTRHALVRHVLSAIDVVVAVSESARADIALRNPGLSGRLALIRNAVPLPPETVRADASSRQLMAAGRLSAEKGFAILLVAWSIAVATDPAWSLLIAGDGPERPGLERLSRHLGIEHRVRFTGWLAQEQLAAERDRSLAVVVPSVWDEPFGLVAAEALAGGRAVIASRVGALPEIVDDGRTGILVSAADPLTLSGVLRQCMADPEWVAGLGWRAREQAERDRAWERCVSLYEDVYDVGWKGVEP